MVNFHRELAKAQKRAKDYPPYVIKNNPIMNLIEYDIPLACTLEGSVFVHNGFSFSLSFIRNIKDCDDSDRLYVLDGVEAWFSLHNKVEGAVLARRPSLLYSIYGYRTYLSVVDMLIDNPWILTSFNCTNPTTDTVLVTSTTKLKGALENEIKTSASDNFMPIGAWGLDYLFKSRFNEIDPDDLGVGPYRLIPLDQYKERIK